MVISWRSALVLLFFSSVLFSSTYLEVRDAAVVPFTTPAGTSGSVTLDLPRRVFIGDEVTLTARVALSASAATRQPSALIGRLEAGYEELAPVGRLTVNLTGGSDIEMVWRLRTGSALVYPGNLWLWLFSDAGEELLLAREFELDSRSYFGMGVLPVRISAGLLALVALMMAGFVYFRSSNQREKQNS